MKKLTKKTSYIERLKAVEFRDKRKVDEAEKPLYRKDG